MNHRLLRLFLRPASLAILAIAAAWGGWWLWPERPLSSFQKRGIGIPTDVHISPDGRYIHSYYIETPKYLIRGGDLGDSLTQIAALFHVPTGSDIIPKDQVHHEITFLENSRAWVQSGLPGVSLIDLQEGNTIWQDQECLCARCSSDGRVIVAYAVKPQGADDESDASVIIYDTQLKTRLAVPNGVTPFAVDPLGRYVVAKIRSNFTEFALLNATDGREVKRFRS